MQAAFTADTGMPYPPKPAPHPNSLDGRIDVASGYAAERERQEGEILVAFMLWVSERHWGLEHSPALVRRQVEAKRRQGAAAGEGEST